MKERPIPYSQDMVRARREGRKTHTRRVVKRPLMCLCNHPIEHHIEHQGWTTQGACAPFQHDWFASPCPYGQPGDWLWVREAWRTLNIYDAMPPRDVPLDAPIWYEADGPAPCGFGRYRHAKFMPRWVSRSMDEVVSVRVERLQEISEADAIAEGVTTIWPDGPRADGGPNHYTIKVDDCLYSAPTAAGVYAMLWDIINGPGSWEANPWVWVVEFKRVQS